MTTSEWLQLAGLTVTVVVILLNQQRLANRATNDIAERLAAERVNTLSVAAALKAEAETRYRDLLDQFTEGQAMQDRNSGEMGSALRRYIETVEKEMHKIEIWSRDHYVQKEELTSLRSDIKTMAADIKNDFRDLNAKIDAKSAASA